MKKITFILVSIAAFVLLLGLASPALAASLGMSPSKVEVTVPANGSTTVNLKAYYYSGDIQFSLVDIPLTVTPETIHVEAANNPQDVHLIIHGDPSLGSKIYNGYIRALGKTGDMIAVAVQVKATVTNLVAGQEPVLSSPLAEATISPTGTLTEPYSSKAVPQNNNAAVTSNPASNQAQTGGIVGIPLSIVIIGASVLIFIGLIAVAVSLSLRRRH
jgi:hypothetical protein